MRRNLLVKVVCIVFTISILFTACGGNTANKDSQTSSSQASTQEQNIDASKLVDAPFDGWVEGLPKIQAPEGFDWKQFAGVQLNFISENTAPSSALSADIAKFESVTGIKVNIEQSDLGIVIEKAGLDFNAKTAKYQIIYGDPYQILSRNYNNFVDLNTFNNDPKLPHIPGGLEDFIPSHVAVDGYMIAKDKLYALPYDCPTIVLAYRKDVIEKYKDQFQSEKGFDWTPGPDMTWDQYYEAAKWITDKAKAGQITEVKYGTGHQAKQYDSLMCDFSDILSAYGGDYFTAPNIGDIGTENPGKSLLTSNNAIQAATFYKKLLSVAAPGSLSWDWSALGEAFQAGDIAMAPEWHEYSSSFEDPSKSKVAGKVGWAVLPKGPERSANIFGGTGLCISKYASEKEQKAAWLFLIWATSPQSEYATLKSKAGGSTPVRNSVYTLPDIKKGMEPGTPESKEMPNLLPMTATLEAWKSENVYMRPKIPQWPQIDTVVYTELSKMLADKQSPEETMKSIAKQSDEITGN